MVEIKKVAVIGAGQMGAQIAAHLANAGIAVDLLDIVPTGEGDRDRLAMGAIEKMMKADPAPFMHPKNARLVTAGNLEDHLDRIRDADLIIESVIENPVIKSGVFKKIDAVRKPGSIVASNTSTIPPHVLLEGQSEAFANDFVQMHFFNPPRYMRLLEFVMGPNTRPEAVAALMDLGDRKLGKDVILGKATPGIVANRLGTFLLQTAVNQAIAQDITVEEADAVLGKPVGMPKTGVFGLLDLVGIDLIPMISRSLTATLPAHDPYHAANIDQPLVTKMIADGYTGRKGKGGFYRLNTENGGKVKEGIDLQTGQYRVYDAAAKVSPIRKTFLACANWMMTRDNVVSRKLSDAVFLFNLVRGAKSSSKVKLKAVEKAGKNIRALCDYPDKIGVYATSVLVPSLAYAASLVPEIADDIVTVDKALRSGFGWKYGPFELIDKLGSDWLIAKLQEAGRPVPALLQKAAGRSFYRVENGKLEFLATNGTYEQVKRPEGVLLLEDIKRASKPVASNKAASLWDIGDGVLCLEFTSKMNSIDGDTFVMLRKAMDIIGDGKGAWKGLVIYNEGENFSAGANLGKAFLAAFLGRYDSIEKVVRGGQEVLTALYHAPFPSVAAIAGMALGGGCEFPLNTSAVQAHAETYMGLVEAGVGENPAWCGTIQMLARAVADKRLPKGPMPPIAKVFETISMAKFSKSAAEAQELGYLRPTDGITMNRDRLLFDGKKRLLDMVAAGYTPAPPLKFVLPGASGIAALKMAVDQAHLAGKALTHDVRVSQTLANTLCGGPDADITQPTTADSLRALEAAAFMDLLRSQPTQARIRHMLEVGKPLRN